MTIKLSQKTFRGTILFVALMVQTAPADSWVPWPSLNQSRGFSASAMDHCGNILVPGGMVRIPGDQRILSSIERLAFDGTSYADTWTTLSVTLPVERYFHSAVCTSGFLYLIGGARSYNPGDAVLQVDRYDLLSNTWDSTNVPPIPYPNISHGLVVDGLGRIWMIGGVVPYSDNEPRAEVRVFDPARPQLGWQVKPSLNTPRGILGAVVDPDGHIWAIGGLDENGNHLNTAEILDPCSDTAWTVVPATLPPQGTQAPIHFATALGADGYIYVIGGWVNNGYTSEVARLNPRDASPSWIPWAPLNLPRAGHTAVLGRDGRIVVAGGEAGSVTSQTSVETLYTGACLGDLDSTREVDLTDLAILLSRFGTVCP